MEKGLIAPKRKMGEEVTENFVSINSFNFTKKLMLTLL